MDSLSDIEDTLADETTRLTEAAEPKLSSMVLKNDEAAVAKGDEVRTEVSCRYAIVDRSHW